MTDERQAGLRDRRLAAATSQLRTVAAFAHRTDQSHKQSFEDCNRRRCVKAKEVLDFAASPALDAQPPAQEERLDVERLLDGIRDEVREAVEEGDRQDCSSSDCIADAVYDIVRVRLRALGDESKEEGAG